MAHGFYKDTARNSTEVTLSYIPKHIVKLAYDSITFSIPICLYSTNKAYSFRSTFVSEMLTEFKTKEHVRRLDKRSSGRVRTLIDGIRIQDDELRKEYVITLRVPVPVQENEAYSTKEYRDSFRNPSVKIECCDDWIIDLLNRLLIRMGLANKLSKAEFSFNFLPQDKEDCPVLFRYLEDIIHVKWGSPFRSYLNYSVLLFGGRNRRVKLYMREKGQNLRKKRYARLEVTLHSQFLRRRGIRSLEDLRNVRGIDPLDTLRFEDDAYFSMLRRRMRGRGFGKSFDKGRLIVDVEPFCGEDREFFVMDLGGDVVESARQMECHANQ